MNKINDSKETNYTEANTTSVGKGGGEFRNEDNQTALNANGGNLNNTTSKKEFYLNKTYNANVTNASNGNITEQLLTLNEESIERPHQQSRI